MRDAKRVSVIVLVQKNAVQALAALRALAAATSSSLNFEIIVLLNGAEGAVAAEIQRFASNAMIVVSEANLGFGGGCNFAARLSNAEYLAFLNDDTLVDPGWLTALVDHADSDDSIAAVGSRIRFPDGTLQEAGSVVWSDGSTAPVGRGLSATSEAWRFRRDVTYASACALLVRRSDFERTGGFDEAYFPAYYEDVDLCLSFAAFGKRVTFEPSAELVHFESQSTVSTFKSYLFRRNHRRFVAKWKQLLPSFPAPMPASSPEMQRAVESAWRKTANVLIIDDRLPDAGLGSGYGRMLELIADLANTQYRVRMYASIYADADIRNVGTYGVGVIRRSLEDELKDGSFSYDIAIISRPHNYERYAATIRDLQPKCRICYDVESLFYRRIEKQALVVHDPDERKRLNAEAEAGRKLEYSIAKSVDSIVCISSEERDLISSIPDHAPIHFVVPLTRAITVTESSFFEREPLALFVAGWAAGPTAPNADGLRWLSDHVVPLIRKRVPYAKIAVTGGNPPVSLLPYGSPMLEFFGYVADLVALYGRARVTLSPLRYGAGVKIKTVESIQHGVPVVATTVGAEGIELSESGAVVIADDPRAFADEVIALLTRPDVWDEHRKATIAQSRAWLTTRGRNWQDVCDAMMQRGASSRSRSHHTDGVGQ